jgi:endonuclease III
MSAKRIAKPAKKKTPKKPAQNKGSAKIVSGTVKGTDPKRVAAILAKLDEAYPAAACELKHDNAFQLLISTILSAQCTDVRVNQVTQELYKKYKKPEDFAYANPAELEREIRPTGFFRNKTKSIIGASKGLIEKFGGQVPRTMEEILTLPGVARKTGNVVLGTAYGIASGVVVDTHVQRLSNRLDLTHNEDRTGSDSRHPQRKVDPVFPPAHLARPPRLRSPQAQVQRVQPREALLLQRQNGVSDGPEVQVPSPVNSVRGW